METLHFAGGTPYETRLRSNAGAGEQVLVKEVAAALRRTLESVVVAGTAKRLDGVFRYPDGAKLVVGGKTGTGDNRIEPFGAKGQRLRSRAINRTATFVFFLGERHFGTLTAYVMGAEAENYQFTSALPVQVLTALAPQLLAYVDPKQPPRCADRRKACNPLERSDCGVFASGYSAVTMPVNR